MKIKRFLVGLLVCITLLGGVSFGILGNPEEADAYVKVKGYYKSNGTYVSPYIRSNPNALKYDNYNYTGGSLYNPSYYSSTRNYSSDWYTPSFLTDPNYYTGRSLYNSRSYSYPSYNLRSWGY